MVVSEVVEDEEDVDNKDVDTGFLLSSWSLDNGVSIVSGLDTGCGDSAFNFFPIICLGFRGDVSKLSKGIAWGFERVVRLVHGPRATSSIVSSKVLLLPSFS